LGSEALLLGCKCTVTGCPKGDYQNVSKASKQGPTKTTQPAQRTDNTNTSHHSRHTPQQQQQQQSNPTSNQSQSIHSQLTCCPLIEYRQQVSKL
jgi:hypothetical protein